MLEHRFGAMGTCCELLVDAPESSVVRRAMRNAEREVHRLEALLSRFQPDTELARLNREGRVRAGPELLELVRLALKARRLTGGRFDPTVLPALVSAGYDRSFESISQRARSATHPVPSCGGQVRIDDATRVIEVDAGVQLDLGGIAKGWTADRLCRMLDLHAPSLVSLGGDIAASRPPTPGVWPVGVESPTGQLTIALKHGGLATSGRDRRRWRHGDEELHHEIDPATGRPSATDLIRVTVAAETAADAEVSATALLLAGEARARVEADRFGIPCVLVTRDDRAVLAGGLS